MTKFKEGDQIYKPKGYKFPGTIVSVFKNTKGGTRLVAEMEDVGILHIFNEGQLEKVIEEQEKRVQWTNKPGNFSEILDMGGYIKSASSLVWEGVNEFCLDVETPEGHVLAELGDYIIKMKDGTFKVDN